MNLLPWIEHANFPTIEEWFCTGQPSLLIVGPPRSGKTQLATALASLVNQPIEIVDAYVRGYVPPRNVILTATTWPGESPALLVIQLSEISRATLATATEGAGRPCWPVMADTITSLCRMLSPLRAELRDLRYRMAGLQK